MTIGNRKYDLGDFNEYKIIALNLILNSPSQDSKK